MSEDADHPATSTQDSITTLFAKKATSNAWFNILLYVAGSLFAVLAVGLVDMTDARWDALSVWQKLGFWSGVGLALTNTWKAAISSSTRQAK